MNVLVTCPPMLGMIDSFLPIFTRHGVQVTAPRVIQALSEAELIRLVPRHDGWIIGDDPATRDVFSAGKAGRLKAAVKWGIGVDNIDFAAARELGIPVSNTPLMFGREVADVAMSYVVALARETYAVHQGVRNGQWPKPRGISLAGRTMALVGFGDTGRNIARRAIASDMRVIVYDPAYSPDPGLPGLLASIWPSRLDEADFIVLTCSLNAGNHHMLDAAVLEKVKNGVRVVNVARGPLIDEAVIAEALQTGKVHSVALDVFEVEPLPAESPLRRFERNIFGSHNGSNTEDAVVRASHRAIEILFGYLGVKLS